jgi:hypothetical protein
MEKNKNKNFIFKNSQDIKITHLLNIIILKKNNQLKKEII